MEAQKPEIKKQKNFFSEAQTNKQDHLALQETINNFKSSNRTGRVVFSSKQQGPLNRVATAFDNILHYRRQFYLYNKKQYAPIEKDNNEIGIINTPHPIGNIPTTSLILFNLMDKIQNFQLRAEVEKEKYTKDKKIETLSKYLNSTIESFEKNIHLASLKLKELEESKQSIPDDLKQHLDELNFCKTSLSLIIANWTDQNNDKIEDLMMSQLALMISEIGIATQVVSREVQDLQNILKQDLFPSDHNKIWDRVDGDGDPDNYMLNILHKDCAGQTIDKIYQICKANPLKGNYEPRVSYEDKKGVAGLANQLQSIAGVNSIESINDLTDEAKYQNAYKNFSNFLNSAVYKKEPEGFINNPLDAILRICAPAFVNGAHGLVISDFNSSDEKIMPRMLFVRKAMEQYLTEQNQEQEVKINQVILPLCESENTVRSASEFFKNLFDQIAKQYTEIQKSNYSEADKNKKLAELRNLFCNEHNELVIGSFSGPSDLTKDVGSASIYLISKLTKDLRDHFEKLQKATGGAENGLFSKVELLLEYGQGTSTKRDNSGVYPPDIKNITNQGTNLIGTNSSINNTRTRARNSVIRPVEIPDNIKIFCEDAIKAHQHFLGQQNGEIVKKINNQISQKNYLFDVLHRRFSNNQGTRGANDIPIYENQRAIGAAFTTAYTGLLQHCGFPRNLAHYESISIEDFQNPIMFNMLCKELYQILNFDEERARTLGFENGLIEENNKYCNNVLSFLNRKLEITAEANQDYKSQVEKIIDVFARNLADKGLNDPNISHQFFALKELRDQIPGINENKKFLLESIQELGSLKPNNPQKESLLAALSFFTNNITNHQLPLVAMGELKTPEAKVERSSYLQLAKEENLENKVSAHEIV